MLRIFVITATAALIAGAFATAGSAAPTDVTAPAAAWELAAPAVDRDSMHPDTCADLVDLLASETPSAVPELVIATEQSSKTNKRRSYRGEQSARSNRAARTR